MKKDATEFEKFDNTIHRVLSVSREELQKREDEWKRERKKTRPKISRQIKQR